MKAIIQSSSFSLKYLFFTASAFLLLLGFSSCQKDGRDDSSTDLACLKSAVMTTQESVFFGPVKLIRATGQPVSEKIILENQNFACYENFTLKIVGGNDKKTRVSSAEIIIDGMTILYPSDFSKNVTDLSFPLSGLTNGSTMEVRLAGAPGSFLELWIEGTLNLVTPTFEQLGPVIQDTEAPLLPTISDNGITGKWSPEVVSTASAGIFSFTFTPDHGQCAEEVTMLIEVTNRSTVVDTDGNVYATVKIGTQWWMAENLKVTTYNNGDIIGTTIPADQPIAEATPKYQWAYKGIEARVETFGRLYTWFTVTDNRGVCPTGWHVPSDVEWTTMTDFLIENGYGYEGSGDDIAKALASQHGWTEDETPGNVGNETSSNNSTGFSALPGGERHSTGAFTNNGYLGRWWSSDPSVTRALYRNSGLIHKTASNNKLGASVRCVKD